LPTDSPVLSRHRAGGKTKASGEFVKAGKHVCAWVCGAVAAVALPAQAERFTLLCRLTSVNGERVDEPETSTVVDTDKQIVNGGRPGSPTSR
jgi:hypothetical protein